MATVNYKLLYMSFNWFPHLMFCTASCGVSFDILFLVYFFKIGAYLADVDVYKFVYMGPEISYWIQI